jgi:trimethylamine--corrinoid protein Co-methyltransferase
VTQAGFSSIISRTPSEIEVMMSRRRRARARQTPEPIQNTAVLVRKIRPYDLLDEEILDQLEAQADRLLKEVGILFNEDPIAIQLFKDAGASVDGERVRFDPGHVRALCAQAPSAFKMYSRNPERTLEFGGDRLIFSPAYGPPFVRALGQERRYATLEDFGNFVKLTYASPWLHHSGGTICEPVDIPVNKRHLDMVYAHLRYSDKPFKGSVTAPERAWDSLEMARIAFGDAFFESHLVIQGNINVNSPLAFDATMSGALRAYAEAGQGLVISPFILGGAMAPVTHAAAVAQAHAETLVGIALAQLVRPGTPVVYGNFLTTMDLKTGAPTFGTAESSWTALAIGQLARRLGLPFRCGGHYTSSKIEDAQAMQESADAMNAGLMAGANYIMQAAGWLEGGLTIGYEKFIMDCDRLGMLHRFVEGMPVDENALGPDAFEEVEPGGNFLGTRHTMQNFKTANHRSELVDNDSFEQWRDNGGMDMRQRANAKWKQMLNEYETPPIDPGVDEALKEFIVRKKSALPDMWY